MLIIGRRTKLRKFSRTTRASHDRAHGTSSCAAALRSSRPRLNARYFSERLRRNGSTGGVHPLVSPVTACLYPESSEVNRQPKEVDRVSEEHEHRDRPEQDEPGYGAG